MEQYRDCRMDRSHPTLEALRQTTRLSNTHEYRPWNDNSVIGLTQLFKYADKPPNYGVNDLVTTRIINITLSLYADSGSEEIFRW